MGRFVNAAEEVVALCGEIGAQAPLWTQGGGANISVKSDEGALWIKASGFRLDRVSLQSGLASAELEPLRERLRAVRRDKGDREAAYSAALKAGSLEGPSLGRLSMEAGFHALLDQRLILHFHSLPAILMAHWGWSDPARWSTFLSREGVARVSLIPAVLPGWELSEAVARAPESDFYILKNHGVIVAGETRLLLQQWRAFEREFCDDFGYAELTQLSRASQPLERAKLAFAGAGPKRCYFPDAAVFSERVAAALDSADGGYRLKDAAWAGDLDACEIWLATRILHSACPNLGEFPPELARVVGGLPAELARKGKTP